MMGQGLLRQIASHPYLYRPQRGLRLDAMIQYRPKLKVYDAMVFLCDYPQARRFASARRLRTDDFLEACAFVLGNGWWLRVPLPGVIEAGQPE